MPTEQSLTAGGAGGDGGGEAGVDRISDLPDAILGSIVSLLPTKDAARTQAIATRWRHIWLAAPLNLDHADLPPGVVSRIILAHEGPGRRFCLRSNQAWAWPNLFNFWLRSAALDKLQELELRDGLSRPVQALIGGSRSLHTFSVDALRFPQLRQLGLDQVKISEPSLHAMISGSPVLEFLLLNRNFGFARVRINSNSLRSIGVCGKPWLQELILENAPCLERLINLHPRVDIRISVTSAPKLETLGFLSHFSWFVFGGTSIQNGRVVSLSTAVRSVKILAISNQIIDVDMVIDLLKCFPCLDKLYMKNYVSKASDQWKHRDVIKYLDIRLKTVVLEPNEFMDSHVDIASFFILNAKELELMRLGVKRCDYNEEFFAEHRRLLEMDKRASQRARLEFALEICPHDYLHIEHVRDLSLTDPFECPC
ncbi:hypothetical protein EJB05_50759, partial [Eragrostis curvula]